MSDQLHVCRPPNVDAWVADHGHLDEDWKCPTCGQDWFVGSTNYCHSCMRSDGREWERYGTGDGKFPLVQARRGGIQFDTMKKD